MGLSPNEVHAKIRAYSAGTSNDLTGVHELTAEKLKAERAKREALRRTFEANQAAEAERRETMLRAEYLAAGNSEADWRRDREHLLREAAMQRARRHSGSLISPAEFLA